VYIKPASTLSTATGLDWKKLKFDAATYHAGPGLFANEGIPEHFG